MSRRRRKRKKKGERDEVVVKGPSALLNPLMFYDYFRNNRIEKPKKKNYRQTDRDRVCYCPPLPSHLSCMNSLTLCWDVLM